MTSVTNTINVQDGTTSLTRQAGGDSDKTFAAFSLAAADLGFRPTLFFRASPDVSTGSVELELSLNGSVVLTQNFGTDVGRTYHEIVDAGIITAANNVLTATAVSGLGTIDLSDIVLMYRVVV